jgi:hypothetical protein
MCVVVPWCAQGPRFQYFVLLAWLRAGRARLLAAREGAEFERACGTRVPVETMKV